jgi:hypothetical protein
MLIWGVGEGKGLCGPGEGCSGCGDSGSISAGDAKLLFIIFHFFSGWCYGQFHEFLFANYG